jgi:hypothetical protein
MYTLGKVQPPKEESQDSAWPRVWHTSQKDGVEVQLKLPEHVKTMKNLTGVPHKIDSGPVHKLACENTPVRPSKIPRIVAKQADNRIQESPIHKDNPGEIMGRELAKRARLASYSTSGCKGQCPKAGWSIDQYCEACHG